MKTIIVISMLLLSYENVNSSELPIFETYNDNELNNLYKNEYDAKMNEWQKLPKTYKKHQVIQVVVPNRKLKSYETILIDAGKVSRAQCDEKSLKYKNKLSQDLKKYVAIRCLTTNRAYEPRKKTSRLRLLELNESKDYASVMNWGGATPEQIKKCDNSMKSKKHFNFYKNKQYNFKYGGCLVYTQNFESSLDKNEPIEKREVKAPWVNTVYFKENAFVHGGVVCTTNSAPAIRFFKNNTKLEDVGYYRNLPKCYKLKKDSVVHATEYYSSIDGVKLHEIKFTIKTNKGPYKLMGRTLIKNITLMQNNDGTLLK